jgi:rhodanese-related sulfurtransferase
MSNGFTNVKAIRGGLQAWQDAGYPTSTGSELDTSGSQPQGEDFAYSNISVDDLQEMLENKDFLLANVHIPLEGNIPQTDVTIPFDDISSYLDLLPADKNAKIVLYCKGNSMSRSASEELIELGYTNVFNLDGGYTAWIEAGLLFESD